MSYATLLGLSDEEIANEYLSNIYQIKIANQNKKQYDESMARAQQNGSLAEPAITLNGNIVVKADDGTITSVSLDTYKQNQQDYRVLTVADLASLRKYSSDMTGNQSVLDIIDNSMGFESFQNLLKQAIVNLGTTTTSIRQPSELNGLAIWDQIKDSGLVDDNDVTLDQLFSSQVITKSQKDQMAASLSYITAAMPERAKVWASLKTGITDSNKALQTMVSAYLLGKLNSSTTISETARNKGKSGSGSGSSGSSTEPYMGPYGQMQADQLGEKRIFSILNGDNISM